MTLEELATAAVGILLGERGVRLVAAALSSKRAKRAIRALTSAAPQLDDLADEVRAGKLRPDQAQGEAVLRLVVEVGAKLDGIRGDQGEILTAVARLDERAERLEARDKHHDSQIAQVLDEVRELSQRVARVEGVQPSLESAVRDLSARLRPEPLRTTPARKP